MFRSKPILLLALSLIFVKVQCTAACIVDECKRSAPAHDAAPCHRHHDGSGDQKLPSSCSHQIIAAVSTPAFDEPDTAIAAPIHASQSVPIARDSFAPSVALDASSPPRARSHTILRI